MPSQLLCADCRQILQLDDLEGNGHWAYGDGVKRWCEGPIIRV